MGAERIEARPPPALAGGRQREREQVREILEECAGGARIQRAEIAAGRGEIGAQRLGRGQRAVDLERTDIAAPRHARARSSGRGRIAITRLTSSGKTTRNGRPEFTSAISPSRTATAPAPSP
ncbi:MAG: hypothetical protein U1F37_19985 [Alphaproteobacteria bacterium]